MGGALDTTGGHRSGPDGVDGRLVSQATIRGLWCSEGYRRVMETVRNAAERVGWFAEDLWNWLTRGTRVHYHQRTRRP